MLIQEKTQMFAKFSQETQQGPKTRVPSDKNVHFGQNFERFVCHCEPIPMKASKCLCDIMLAHALYPTEYETWRVDK